MRLETINNNTGICKHSSSKKNRKRNSDGFQYSIPSSWMLMSNHLTACWKFEPKRWGLRALGFRQTWTGRTDKRTAISISWAPVGAKKGRHCFLVTILYPTIHSHVLPQSSKCSKNIKVELKKIYLVLSWHLIFQSWVFLIENSTLKYFYNNRPLNEWNWRCILSVAIL